MRIAIDAMGGDRAPRINVRGAVEAAKRWPGHEVVLVGDQDKLRAELKATPGNDCSAISIEHASQVVEMGESPVATLRRKRDSSILRAVKLVKENKADALVSAGDTGAAMAACVMYLTRLPGIQKPGIAVPFPTQDSRPCLLIDVGANPYCKPQHLFQYGVMASVYSRRILGVDQPRVGLLNIGEEAVKGTALTRETQRLFESSGLNYKGSVEGRDIFNGRCDVVVCDGFVGNVVLKTSEGLAEILISMVKGAIGKNWRRKLGAALCKDAFADLKHSTDYSEYGGAPLLGVDGICIICHGSSNSHAIANAIGVAIEHARYEVNEEIVSEVKAATEACSLSSG